CRAGQSCALSLTVILEITQIAADKAPQTSPHCMPPPNPDTIRMSASLMPSCHCSLAAWMMHSAQLYPFRYQRAACSFNIDDTSVDVPHGRSTSGNDYTPGSCSCQRGSRRMK